MSKIIIFVVLLVVLIMALSFSVINAHTVQLNYYLGNIELPLSFLIVGAIIVGAFLGVAAMTRSLVGQRLEIARLRRSVKTNTRVSASPNQSLPLNNT